MSQADLVAIVAFLGLVLLGLFIMAVQSALRQRPAGRVQARLGEVTESTRSPLREEALQDLSRAEREARRRQRRQSMGWLGRYLERVETVSGRRGVVLLVGGTIILFVLAVPLAMLVLPLPWPARLAVGLVVPTLGATMIYRHLNGRYQRAFLDQLPDILDMIIRASQAGVPVTQSIRNVGEEFTWPAGPEFRRIGDSLYLGNDMTVVFDAAEERIRLPDFSFLTVCLLLQRETGGSLSETLSNLATVVRARRDLRLKTRAMTAEGRLTSLIISLIPPFILVILQFTNSAYISVLYTTETGHPLLMAAAGMLVVGILAIRHIAKLET